MMLLRGWEYVICSKISPKFDGVQGTGFASAYTLLSTNEDNADSYAPHVLSSANPGSVTLTFRNPSAKSACFEIRIDGEVAYSTDPPTFHYFPPLAFEEENLYPSFCMWPGDPDVVETYDADTMVEIRHAFGAPDDFWYFDWTRFDVLPALGLVHKLKGKCKGGEWSLDVSVNGGDVENFLCAEGKENEIDETIVLPLSRGVVVLSAEGPGTRECSSSFTYEQDLDKIKLECKDGSKHDRVAAKFEIKRHGHDD